MKKYAEAYELSGNAVHQLATSLAGIKGRVSGALREIKRIRPDQRPDRDGVKHAYNKLVPHLTNNIFDSFYRTRSTKLQEIANTIYELHSQINLDYHDQ